MRDVPSAQSAALEIEGVDKAFGGKPVLRSVSLSVEAGERVALLGPSGSGKSSLLGLIAGFERPDAGDIRADGRSLLRLPTHSRDVGVVFQNYALFPHLSVAENIAYPLVRRRLPRTETRDRVDRLLASVRLGSFADRAVQTLSGGQQQRVAIARALAAEPSILLMDEPMGALDRALREQLQAELKLLLQETRTTVLYVTHDQREALALTDRIAILNAGRLEQVGPAETLYSAPATAFAAAFLWAGANRLTARAEGEEVILAGRPLAVRWPGKEPRAPSGTAVEIVFRPEDAWIGDPAPGALPATILTSLFAGTHRTVQLALADGTQVNAVQPADAPSLAPGTGVGLSIRPGTACAYLPVEGA